MLFERKHYLNLLQNADVNGLVNNMLSVSR